MICLGQVKKFNYQWRRRLGSSLSSVSALWEGIAYTTCWSLLVWKENLSGDFWRGLPVQEYALPYMARIPACYLGRRQGSNICVFFDGCVGSDSWRELTWPEERVPEVSTTGPCLEIAETYLHKKGLSGTLFCVRIFQTLLCGHWSRCSSVRS